jgi:anti-sigma factor RsiW
MIRQGTPYFQSPTHLENRIRSSVRREGKAKIFAIPLKGWAVAASFAFMILGFMGLRHLSSVPSAEERIEQEVVSSHIRSLMVDHLEDVASTDQHTVKPWFNGKLDFSPAVLDLSQEGFPLVGGRLDYLKDRPVAALVYQRQKHIINLFTWPSSSHIATETKMTTRQGYHVLHWTQSDMNCWAVSDLNPVELKEFAGLFKKQAAISPALP